MVFQVEGILQLNPLQERKLLSKENLTNGDLDDEAFTETDQLGFQVQVHCEEYLTVMKPIHIVFGFVQVWFDN